jgi:hypothetical protein
MMHARRAFFSFSSLSSCLVVMLHATVARAEAKSEAQALFDEGLRLFDAKDYKNACEKFSASQRVDPAAATLLNLGRCYEASGRLASAHKAYTDAVTQARTEHDEPRAKVAKQRDNAIASSIPKLTIQATTPDVHVERNGEPATLGIPLEVDAGPQAIVASAPGKKPATINVTLAVGETKRVDVPALEDAVVATGPAPSKEPPRAAASSSTSRRTIALALGGAGIVAAGVGTYFGLHASSLKSDAEPNCSPAHVCNAQGVELTHSAGHAADVSTVLFLVGGVFIAAAVVVGFALPDKTFAANAGTWTF